MKKNNLSIVFFLLVTAIMAQNVPNVVIDPDFGIQGYEEMVISLNGDSSRICDGKPCAGHIEDYYSTGQLLHKGFYIRGKLQSFKNFFPNGQLERKFGLVDDDHSKLQVYFESGAKKSEVKYTFGNVKEWTDYYENGKVEYEEKYDNNFEFVIYRNSYYSNGKPQNTMEFEKRKDHTYYKKEYHENGKIAAEGLVHFFDLIGDYRKIEEWKIYDKSGKHIKTQSYVNGTLNGTVDVK